MKVYNILLYSDFFADFEIIKTNIPILQIEHFIFLYCNWFDLGIDFEEVVRNSGYKFKPIASNDAIFKYDVEKYPIKVKYLSSDFVLID